MVQTDNNGICTSSTKQQSSKVFQHKVTIMISLGRGWSPCSDHMYQNVTWDPEIMYHFHIRLKGMGTRSENTSYPDLNITYSVFIHVPHKYMDFFLIKRSRSARWLREEKALTAAPDCLCSIPGTHVIEKEHLHTCAMHMHGLQHDT